MSPEAKHLPHSGNPPQALVLMGVSGSGKTSVGERLSEILGWPFFDGDDFHPRENIEKMAAGIPLDDSDRAPWLTILNDLIAGHLSRGNSMLLACSALKQSYRDRLADGNLGIRFVYLKGDFELIYGRMQARSDHYMRPDMLRSQFEILEEPLAALTVDISQTLDSITKEIILQYHLDEGKTSHKIGANMEPQADIGLIGLAVMGQNLVLNMDEHGYTVAIYNRTTSKVDRFLENEAKDTKVIGTHTIEELVASLKSPRRVMLMVKAGWPVDAVIEDLLPHLDKGDIIIDGGNSNFEDSIRRTESLEKQDFLFIGTGVSGGEEGARHGPSIMPGGSPEAWPQVKEILQRIAAKVEDGTPCCDWVGENGAGHFVKMVHNGIEYGDMQLISEAYHLMKDVLGLSYPEMQATFAQWDQGVLDSYLIEITADILSFQDEEGEPLLEKILDAAGQKGTGRWTAINALDLGIPLTLIAEAVLARSLSALKGEREIASKTLTGPQPHFDGDVAEFVGDIRQALYAAKIISYTQGFMLLRAAAEEYEWDLDYGGIALMWREGCIIRSAFLDDIQVAYQKNPELSNLLLDDYFRKAVDEAQASWRRVVAKAVENAIPAPAMSSALAFFDGYRSEWLPANMIQAQRDYFGAHTYERVDKPRGEFFHTDWTGRSG